MVLPTKMKLLEFNSQVSEEKRVVLSACPHGTTEPPLIRLYRWNGALRVTYGLMAIGYSHDGSHIQAEAAVFSISSTKFCKQLKGLVTGLVGEYLKGLN